MHEVVQHEVRHAESVLDRLDAERDREVALAHARRAHEEHVLLRSEICAGGERLDLRAVDPGLKRPVEALEGLAHGQPRELERGRDPALVLLLDLTLEHALEEGERGQVVARSLFDELADTRGGMSELQGLALLGEAVQVDPRLSGRRLGAHRSTSTSAAYWSIGRVSAAGSGSAAHVRPDAPERPAT